MEKNMHPIFQKILAPYMPKQKTEVIGGGSGCESVNPARQSCLRLLAIKIVNMVNEKYNLELLTVDSAAMTEDVLGLLNSEQNVQESDTTEADSSKPV